MANELIIKNKILNKFIAINWLHKKSKCLWNSKKLLREIWKVKAKCNNSKLIILTIVGLEAKIFEPTLGQEVQ